MDLVKIFIQKNLTTEVDNKELKLSSVKELFNSIENKNNVSRILYRELHLPNNPIKFNKIKSLVNQYINIWSESDDFNKFIKSIDHNYNLNERLRYVNSLFINFYKTKLLNINDFMQHEIDNNPYQDIFEYQMNKKKNSDILVDDYNYITFNNYNDKYTTNLQFSNKYNKIPYYEKGLYTKHIDHLDNGSFRERKLENNNFKKYNNSELLNNVSYLR